MTSEDAEDDPGESRDAPDWPEVDRGEARRRTERAFDRLLSEPMPLWRRIVWKLTRFDATPWGVESDLESALDDDLKRKARSIGFEPVALVDKRVWNGTRQLSEIWVGPENFVKLEVVRAVPESEREFTEQSQRSSPIGRTVLSTYFDDATSFTTWDDERHEIEFATEARTTSTSLGSLRRDRQQHLTEADRRCEEEGARPMYCTDVELYRDHVQMRYHHLVGTRHLRTGVIRWIWNVVSKCLWAAVLVALMYVFFGSVSMYHVQLLALAILGTVMWDVYSHYRLELDRELPDEH